MTKIHGGSGNRQGVLNRSPQPKPQFHGGTKLAKGQTRTVSTPASRQPRLATSYHGNMRRK